MFQKLKNFKENHFIEEIDYLWWLLIVPFFVFGAYKVVEKEGIEKGILGIASIPLFMIGILIAGMFAALSLGALYVAIENYRERKNAKQEVSDKEKIIIDAVLEENGDKYKADLPYSLLQSTIFADKELKLNPVTKLAYEFNSQVFSKILEKYNADQLTGDTLLNLIRLNSGYLNTRLIQSHFNLNNQHSDMLLGDLVANKQAAHAPVGREMYTIRGVQK